MTELVEGILDELPVASLPDRYGVARSQIYNRIKALGIQTTRRDNKAYVNTEQIALMDRMHELLQQDYTLETATAAILGKPASQYTLVPGVGSPVEQSRETAGQIEILQMLVAALASQPPDLPANPLSHFEQLQTIADHDWRPSTSELAKILGLKSLPGKQFERYGFRFTRAGRNGAESAWKVEKI
jgi:hypothetical protein